MVLVVGVFLWRRGDRVSAVLAVAAVPLGYGLAVATKAAVARPRPTWVDPATLGVDPLHVVGWDPASGAFPSGHALQSLLVFGYLAAVAPRRFRPIAARWGGILVLAIGLSRVILGAHWPTDVLGAWLMGATALLLVLGIRWWIVGPRATPALDAPEPRAVRPARRRSTRRRPGARGS